MRTRLPVKLKLAVVTAALTFGILCLFAVVVGAVAEQRIRAGFDDDLRATVADLVNRLDVRAAETVASLTLMGSRRLIRPPPSTRSPRRAPCGAVAARRPPLACDGGWR